MVQCVGEQKKCQFNASSCRARVILIIYILSWIQLDHTLQKEDMIHNTIDSELGKREREREREMERKRDGEKQAGLHSFVAMGHLPKTRLKKKGRPCTSSSSSSSRSFFFLFLFPCGSLSFSFC